MNDKIISEKTESDIIDEISNDIFNDESLDKPDYIFRSKKSGLMFPAAIMFLIFTVTLVLLNYSDSFFIAESNIENTDRDRLISAESEVLAALRIKSDRLLKQKDIEISGFKVKISEYDEKISMLKNLLEIKSSGKTIENGENEYQEYSGLGITELEQQIKKMEREKLETSRKLEEEYRKKEEILDELEKKEKDVLGDVVLAAETSDALSSLTEFNAILEQQNIVQDQLMTLQKKVLYDINNKRYAEAENDISGIKRILTLDSNSSLPALMKRKQLELEYADFLENHVKAIKNPKIYEEYMNQNLIYQIETAMDAIKYADVHFSAGNIDNAERLYREGMKSIPFINNADTKLRSIEKKNQDSSDKQGKAEDKTAVYADIVSETRLFGLVAAVNSRLLTIEPFKGNTAKTGQPFIIKTAGKPDTSTETGRGMILESNKTSAKGEITILKNPDQKIEINSLIYLY